MRWVYYCSFNWDFILRTIWVCHYNSSVFFTSCYLYLLVSCAQMLCRLVSLKRLNLSVWCSQILVLIFTPVSFILISICLFSLDFNWDIDCFSCFHQDMSQALAHLQPGVALAEVLIAPVLSSETESIPAGSVPALKVITRENWYFLAFDITYKWNLWLQVVCSAVTTDLL